MRRDSLGPRREPRKPILRWQGAGGRTEECALSNTRPVTIGREATNTIAVDSRLVSKAHALVEFRDGEYTIQDLESANGTKVNGEPTSVRVLEPGDRIQIGDVEMTFLDLAAEGGRALPVVVSGGSKAVRLALAGGVTLLVMVGLLLMLIRSASPPEVTRTTTVETLAAASPELMTQLRASVGASPAVKDVLQHAALGGVPPAQALLEEGRLRLEAGRWRDAAQLLAAAEARDPKNPNAKAAFEQAAAQLDRAASKALDAAELANFGMRYDDALLHADEVLQLVDAKDPRHERARKVADEARAKTRTR